MPNWSMVISTLEVTTFQSINQSINPLFKHVTPRSTEVLVKTCTCIRQTVILHFKSTHRWK